MIETLMQTGYGKECEQLEGKNLATMRLINTIRERPDLPVIPFVSSDVVPDNDHSWYKGEFGMCSIDAYYADDERIWLRADNEDDMLEKWADDHWEELENLPRDEVEEIVNKRGMEWIESLPWIEAIICWIDV